MGFGVVVAAVANGASLGSALAATYGVIGAAAIQIGAGVLINQGIAALKGKPDIPSAPDIRRDLSLPQAAPVKRFVYGNTRAAGTPVFWHATGKTLWMCYLFNSRPSEGPFDIYLDKRALDLDGDMTDFEGGLADSGAYRSVDGARWNFWLGQGDQTSPPDYVLSQLPGVVQAADAYEDCTVLWARFETSNRERFLENFPNSPPQVELVGKWSRVWDPREGAQDPDDPSTWTWSRNHALCVLDALRQNPVRPYGLRNLILDTWSDGADDCDGSRGIKAGGSEAMFTLGGTLAFNKRELLPLIQPMMQAAAAEFSRVAGRLGYVSAVWREPEVQITNVLEEMVCKSLQPGDGLPTVVECKYLSPNREHETAWLKPWNIPGAAAADGGDRKPVELDLSAWCDSPYQAMHVRKIEGLRMRHQREIAGNVPGAALNLVPGATAQVTLPSPLSGRNGVYKVTSMHPALDVMGGSGVALRCPMSAREETAAIYAYDPEVDEEDLQDPGAYDGTRGFPVPSALGYDTGSEYDRITGSGTVNRIKMYWDPTEAFAYEMQWQLMSETVWSVAPDAPDTQLDGSNKGFAFIDAADPVAIYRARVRALHLTGASDWVTLENISIGLGVSNVAMTAVPGGLQVTGDAPDIANLAQLRLWRAATGAGFGAATAIGTATLTEIGTSFDHTFGPDVSNLVVNGDFADGSGWSGTDWVISGGVATHTPGSTDALTRAVSGMVAGELYRVAYDVTGRTQGSVQMRLVGSSFSAGSTNSANGTLVQDGTAPAGIASIEFVPDTDFDGAIDNVRVYPSADEMLPIGEADFWITPVTLADQDGLESGPFTRTII